MKKITYLTLTGLLLFTFGRAQDYRIPASYSNIERDANGLYFKHRDSKHYADTTPASYTIKQLLGQPQGTENGIQLDFGNLSGTITYGMIPYGQAPSFPTGQALNVAVGQALNAVGCFTCRGSKGDFRGEGL